MRKYQPIWEQLKEHLTSSIAASPAMHARIIKAVIKEKNSDLGWKLITSEKNNIYKLRYEIEGQLVSFYLDVDKSIKNL